MLDVKFDGLKCALNCENSIFQLNSVYYHFDVDLFSLNVAQGNSLCNTSNKK